MLVQLLHVSNHFFAQFLLPNGVVCAAACGPHAGGAYTGGHRNFGEFDWEGNPSCGIEFLGLHNRAGCDEACALRGYEACDRMAAGGGYLVPCYGYSSRKIGILGDDTDGACSVRNMDYDWESWLTCRDDDGVPITAPLEIGESSCPPLL